jgi:pimeloyl-ACP methyl ester carboxylesterase
MDIGSRLAHSQDIAGKVARLFERRVATADRQFQERLQRAWKTHATEVAAKPLTPWEMWSEWSRYALDFGQRAVLFWDTLRQRGNNYIEHVQQGQPPVLHFEYEIVLDGRHFEKPVNYALVRITPPAGVEVGATRRPYLIIDPRAGHGPGIGGFKDDSQVGVALQGGHPVYFVIFFREPEPGQTLLDVCAAEQRFVRKVRELHPDSPKPAIVGNCQGGWAAMMLAASDPDDTGPLVINGAPMSYWGGAWQEGEGDNPMRYAGGLLGGSWLASLTADLGNGIFDGAWLVQNFENLHPANTFWDKYYHVFANADTEPPRFLEFERWWGGFYLMNREEIEWITRNLFIGNKLWSGETRGKDGKSFDLRDIKVPIVLFASMGDNITPPQQAFNWVADIYGSTDEIKARGQVIVGLLHHDVGHLGIFVSGRVARKEHAQIVSVLKSVELLPPGLYGMEIIETTETDGTPGYDVVFHERRLEDVVQRLNRFQRSDERPFETVAQVSEFNQRAYELFARPLVQSFANEYTARLAREFHPLRLQRWILSDRNPWLGCLAYVADAVKRQRRAVPQEATFRHSEALYAEVISASLDYYRGIRDAVSEAAFFELYGALFSFYLGEPPDLAGAEAVSDARQLPFVQEAIASIADGGYAEAFARICALLAPQGDLPLSKLALRQDIARDYADLLPKLALEDWRRIRGEQEIIVRYEREQALETLPKLLADEDDRDRMLHLFKRLLADERVQQAGPSDTQMAMLERIRDVLGRKPARRRAPVLKKA